MPAGMSDETLQEILVRYLKAQAAREPQIDFVEGNDSTSEGMFNATAQSMIAAAKSRDSQGGIQALKREMREWAEAHP